MKVILRGRRPVMLPAMRVNQRRRCNQHRVFVRTRPNAVGNGATTEGRVGYFVLCAFCRKGLNVLAVRRVRQRGVLKM